MSSIKRFVSTFVTLTTIVWSMGGALLFPSIAQAATLSPGDLIKASGPAVYYYAGDGKRYVFPNEKTYFSWYSNFSSVVTITDAELAAIMIGGNVTIRPGTKLVKITTDPKTYAVSSRCGMLHWIESETIAKALYGDNWNTQIVDVPDAFFVDYQVGSSLSTPVHPNGQIIHYTSAPDTYYVVMDGKKRMLSGSSVSDNKLNLGNAEALGTTPTYPDGTNVTGYEAELGKVACESSTPTVTGGVSVTLASDTPAGRTVPLNSSSNKLIKVNLTAGNQAAQVNGLKFKRVGTGNTSDFSNVYLYDENMVRITTGRTINSTTHMVEFNSLDIDVPANATKSVYVYADFAVDAANSGGEHALQVKDAASVVIEGTGTVTGNFPITGNTFKIGSVSAATVDVQKGVTPTNPTVGEKDVEISNFKITSNVNTTLISQISLYQAGSIDNADLDNLELVQGTDVVAKATGISNDNLITFVFTTPFEIGDGITKVFKVMADLEGRSGRTIRTYVEYSTDVTATDKVYNSGALVCLNSSDTGCTGHSANFDGTTGNYIEVTLQGGSLTITNNGPATANVAKGTLGVRLLDFAMTSEDNDLEVRKLNMNIASTNGGLVKGSSNTEYFRNIKVIDVDSGVTVMGPINMGAAVVASSSDTGTLTFTDSWVLKAGESRDLAIVADLANSEDILNQFFANGQRAYKATLKQFNLNDIRVEDTNEALELTKIVPNADIVGNAMTVKAASLSADLATDPSGTTIVKKQQNVPSVGISLAAGQQSAVTLTSIKVTGVAEKGTVPGVWNTANFDQLVTSLKIFDTKGTTSEADDVQVGDAEGPVNGVANFTGFQLAIDKGTTKNLIVKATIASQVASTSTVDNYMIGIAGVNDITAQDADANTVNPTVSTQLVNNTNGTGTVKMSVRHSGTVTIQEGDHPSSDIVVGGAIWRVFASYKATAQWEPATIDRVQVIHLNDGGRNSDFTKIAIATNGVLNGQDVLSAGTTGTKDIDLTSNPIKIAKDGNATFEIWGEVKSPSASSSATANSARSGDTPSLGVASDTQVGEWDTNYAGKINIRTTGDASGERLYDTYSAAKNMVGNTMVVRRSVPVVAKQQVTSEKITSGGDAELYRFQVAPAADGGDIYVKQIVFQVTTAGSVTLNNFKFYQGTNQLTANTDVFIVDAVSGADISGLTNLASGYVAVIFRNNKNITSAQSFSLRGLTSYAGTGNSVQTRIYTDTGSSVTGWLADDGGISGWGSGNVYGIDIAATPDNMSNADAGFLWSDGVEPTHNDATSTAGTRDWTNGVYVDNLTDIQSLSQS